MKKLLFGLIATFMFGFVGSAQTVQDFLVKSEESITKDSKDGYFVNFVIKVLLPNGIQISNNENFALYTLNDENFKMIEIPVISNTHTVNLMFVMVDLKSNISKAIFKNYQKERYDFYDENLALMYSCDFSNNKSVFTNNTNSSRLPTCYQACRAKALLEIESDWLSDFACSINPCGAAIALYCGYQCRNQK